MELLLFNNHQLLLLPERETTANSPFSFIRACFLSPFFFSLSTIVTSLEGCCIYDDVTTTQ
jgi:hypothetical protein